MILRSRAFRSAGILAALIAVPLLPLFLGRSFWQRDIIRYTYPMKLYLRERLLAGELGLWNVRDGLGRPFFALVQPGALYPGNAILILPPPLGFDLFMAAHLFIAALGARAWLRAEGSDERSAVVGAALLALSGYVVTLLGGNGIYMFGAAWVPWALAASAQAGPLVRRIGLTALAVALVLLAGDPQALFFVAGCLVVRALGSAPVKPSLIVAVGGIALGVAICAAQLLPALEVAAVGRSGGVAVEEAGRFAFPPARLIELVWPGAFGTPFTRGWFVHPFYAIGGVPFEPLAASPYMGLATPWLALAAVATRRRLDIALAALGLLALLLAFGPYAPVWKPFFHYVPGAKMFRYPEKYLFITTLCLAALAARGLPVALAHPRRAAKVAAGLVLAHLIGAAIATRFGGDIAASLLPSLTVSVEEARRAVSTRAWIAAAIALGCALPFALFVRDRLPQRALALIFCGVWLGDVVVATLPLLDWAPSSIYRERSPLVEDLEKAGWARDGRVYRPALVDFAPMRLDEPERDRLTLLPNCGFEDGVDHADPYDLFKLDGEKALYAALVGDLPRRLQVTATRFALLPDGAVRPGLTVRHRYPAFQLSLVETEGVSPRAYLATDAVAASDVESAAARVAAPAFRPGASAVVEGGEPRAATGRCSVERWAPEHITLRCDASAPAYAVVADSFFPGWTATVNAHEAPVLRANAALRAVPVGTGASVVELRYRPRGLGAGFAVSAIALALALLALVKTRKSR